MKNLNKKLLILAVMAVFLCTAVLPASASSWQEKASNLWNAAKERGSEIVDTVRENGPEWVESAKEAAGNAKDKAIDGLSEAYDKASEALQDQQDEFYAREEILLSGNNPREVNQNPGNISPNPPASDEPDPNPPASYEPGPNSPAPVISSTPDLTPVSDESVGKTYEIPPEYRDAQTTVEPAPEPSCYVDAEGNILPFGITPEMMEHAPYASQESGLYEVDGRMFHYNAETGEWTPASLVLSDEELERINNPRSTANASETKDEADDESRINLAIWGVIVVCIIGFLCGVSAIIIKIMSVHRPRMH